GQKLQALGLWAAIERANADQRVVRPRLGVLDEDIEVATFVEHARVHQLELGTLSPATAVLLHQPGIGERGLRILVQHLQVRVRRRCVEVVVLLLHVLAVVALLVGEPEQPLFEDRISFVPERERKTNALPVIRVAGDAVFAPAIRTTARVVVRKIVPSGAKLAVILTHGAPLALAQVRPETPPNRVERRVLSEALGFHRAIARRGHYGQLAPTTVAARFCPSYCLTHTSSDNSPIPLHACSAAAALTAAVLAIVALQQATAFAHVGVKVDGTAGEAPGEAPSPAAAALAAATADSIALTWLRM